MKTCSKCDVCKELTEFNACQKSPDGKKIVCRSCQSESRKAYYQKNKEKENAMFSEYYAANLAAMRARALDWHFENRERSIQKSKDWKAANPERVKEYREAHKARDAETRKVWAKENKDRALEYRREYSKKNPDKLRAYVRNRRAKIKGNGGTHSDADILRIRLLQKNKCACCKTDLAQSGHHVDHVIPLAMGGSNDSNNLQLMCPACNQTKAAKHPVDFMQSKGFLL